MFFSFNSNFSGFSIFFPTQIINNGGFKNPGGILNNLVGFFPIFNSNNNGDFKNHVKEKVNWNLIFYFSNSKIFYIVL